MQRSMKGDCGSTGRLKERWNVVPAWGDNDNHYDGNQYACGQMSDRQAGDISYPQPGGPYQSARYVTRFAKKGQKGLSLILLL